MHKPAFLTAALLAAATLCPTPLTADATAPMAKAPAVSDKQAEDTGPVTSEGFDRFMLDASLYAEVRIEGKLGEDVHRDAVLQTIRMAAADPNIHHMVYLIDSSANEGALFDKEVVGTHQDELEVHAVVGDAVFLAMFPVFFCDSIFVVDGARIGGMPLHNYFPGGSDEVMAKWIGITTNQLASAAETHGHNPDIVRAMIDQTKSLHFWRVRGETFVSNTPPPSTGEVDDYEHVQPLYEGATITLDHEQAVKFGLARHLDEYDAYWIGEQIGAMGWVPANRYDLVAAEIAVIVSELTPLMEALDNLDKQLPAVQRNNQNRNDPNVTRMINAKRTLERAVESIEQLNEQLENLYEVHPERHAYFADERGRTVLADPEQWAQDVSASQRLLSQTRSGFGALRATIAQLDVLQRWVPGFSLDPAMLDDYDDIIDGLIQQLDGIRRHGNAHYWDHIYTEPYPEDAYGETYG